MKTSEAIRLITQVGDELTKVSTEITSKIDELKNADPDLSPEGQAAVERLETIARALDDIVPDVSTPDATRDNAPVPPVTPVPAAEPAPAVEPETTPAASEDVSGGTPDENPSVRGWSAGVSPVVQP